MHRYQDFEDQLFSRARAGMKLGLDRMEKALSALENPHLQAPVIHVAGSNGKGSVCAFVAASLQAAGLKVGLFSSPHLEVFGERFRVNGVPASKAQILQAWELVEAQVPGARQESSGDKAEEQLSFFELVTLLAFVHFSQQQVDVAVIEVGLGGRLDSTNVVRPIVTAITPLAVEHREFLGSDLASVAREKAGILKAGAPLVLAKQETQALEVIEERARKLGVSVYLEGRDFQISVQSEVQSEVREESRGEIRGEIQDETRDEVRKEVQDAAENAVQGEGQNSTQNSIQNSIQNAVQNADQTGAQSSPQASGSAGFNPQEELHFRSAAWDLQGLHSGLRGPHQRQNLAIALQILELAEKAGLAISKEAAAHGASAVQWPGRLETVPLSPKWDAPEGLEVVLDGAHNPQAAKALADAIAPLFSERKVHLIFGALDDKELEPMVQALGPKADSIITTRVDSPRSVEPEFLASLFPKSPTPGTSNPAPIRSSNNLHSALLLALDDALGGDVILVCGSLLLVGEARALLRGEKAGGPRELLRADREGSQDPN